MPVDVDGAWQEARDAFGAGAYTAGEITCRKILTHCAVDVAEAKPGKSFAEYVKILDDEGYVTGLKDVVGQVRTRGITAKP